MSKNWTIKSAEGERFTFIPVFKVDDVKLETECTDIKIKINDKIHTFNFINLYQFIYFCANEELRQGLLQRYQRRVNYIPYEVSFKLDKEECDKQFAKRRINLPVDELTIAYARNEGWKLYLKNKIKKPWEMFKRT